MGKELGKLQVHYHRYKYKLWVHISPEAMAPIAISPQAQALISNVGVHTKESQKTVETQLIGRLLRKTSMKYDDSRK